jgi:hypothetical protein
LWEADHAITTASITSSNKLPTEAAIDAVLRDVVHEPFGTTRFHTAKGQPAFYELPEANTIERLYGLVNQTYGSKQTRLLQRGEFDQVRRIIIEFRRCLFPEEIDWKWQLNAFQVPLDRPLNATLFYRCLRRQDLKKERWMLESSNRILGVPPNDYRDGDGILSKGELLLLPAWVRGSESSFESLWPLWIESC